VPSTAGAASTKLFAGVKASGDASCTSVANACTLGKALSIVTRGGVIELVTSGIEGTSSTYYASGPSGFSVATSGTSAAAPVEMQPAAGVRTPILDGGGDAPVLNIGKAMHLVISGLEIQNGFTAARSGGGGITNNAGAALTITDSTFSDNYGPQDGGAIENGSGGALTVTNSTFSGNSACLGGAIANGYGTSATATIERSTFSGNSAICQGGAIDNGDGGAGVMTIGNSTFWENSAPDGGAVANGDGSSAKLTVTSSTFSDDAGSSDGATIDTGGGKGNGSGIAVAGDLIAGSCRQLGGSWTDQGDNAASSSSCLKGGKGDVSSTQLATDLGPLADNGGTTETMGLLPGSPASGLIPNPTSGLCPVVDQTEQPSPIDAPCSAGALQPHPVISSVAFSTESGVLSVRIAGTGFGTQGNLGPPTSASTCSGKSASGDDYANNLYLTDRSLKWNAGQGPPYGCSYYGLLLSSYSNTGVVFTLGSDYPSYGSLSSGAAFTMHLLGAVLSGNAAASPKIISFSPKSGRAGTIVTVKGLALAHASAVTFNGVKGSVSDDMSGTVKVKVPPGATSGVLQIRTSAGTATSATAFTVT
jgi:hypothetical protein